MRNAVWVILAAVLVGGPAVAQPACNLSALDARAAGPDCARAWMDKNLHVNDILTVGTHNSYKKAVPDKIMSLIRMASSKGNELDYSHVPLAEQLDAVRRKATAAHVGNGIQHDTIQRMRNGGY